MEIHRNGSNLFYEKAGNGKETLFLFHGFGQDHTVFKSLTDAIADHYTCYSFDLFYHGNSTWRDAGHRLDKREWKAFLDLLLARENITHFSVLGFSLGAKLALATFECYPSLTSNIVLAAPDGIPDHPLYRVATFSRFTRAVFHSAMRSPRFFSVLTDASRRLRLVHPSLLRFAGSQTDTGPKRLKLFNAWVVFSGLKISESALARTINDHKTKVYIFLGQGDLLINERRLRKFISRLNDPVVHVLKAKHHHLVQAVAEAFPEIVKDRSDIQP